MIDAVKLYFEENGWSLVGNETHGWISACPDKELLILTRGRGNQSWIVVTLDNEGFLKICRERNDVTIFEGHLSNPDMFDRMSEVLDG